MKQIALVLALVLVLAGCQPQPRIVPIETLTPQTQGPVVADPGAQDDALQASQQPAETPYARINDAGETIQQRINPPQGYSRTSAQTGSMAAYLRSYPLLESGSRVKLHTGESRTDAGEAAVMDVSLGEKNYEGPAGSMVRLLAEYFYSQSRYDDIEFTLGVQFAYDFNHWREGKVLQVDGNSIKWVSGGQSGDDGENFEKYLQTLFRHVSVDTMKKDMTLIENPDSNEIRTGDVFIGKDKNGKTICAMVVDICQSDVSDARYMLLAQGGSPAQMLHIVENPGDAENSPWYDCGFSNELVTPDASYDIESRYRFTALD